MGAGSKPGAECLIVGFSRQTGGIVESRDRRRSGDQRLEQKTESGLSYFPNRLVKPLGESF